MAQGDESSQTDGVGFWAYPCRRCGSPVETREQAHARTRLCVLCFRPRDLRAPLPPGVPALSTRFTYPCRRCSALIRGTWSLEDDADGSIRARVKLRLCEECFREPGRPRRPAPAGPPPKPAAPPPARPKGPSRPVEDRPCLHGTPAQHCAYCNPGRYPYRPWRKSSL